MGAMPDSDHGSQIDRQGEPSRAEATTVNEATDAGVDAIGLTKRYGRDRLAVADLSFTVAAGQICALLGPNGAGKTSTMRMLLGLSRPDRGQPHILGERVTLGSSVLRRTGALIDGPGFVPHLSGLANLKLLWGAGGQSWPPPGLEDALDLAGLGPALGQKVKRYSMGMKQRLMLAQSLMGEPEVLILDEPANGLDPAEVRKLRHTLTCLAGTGVAILISSHQLAEVQQFATHLVVMNQGRLVTAGALADLLQGQDRYQFRVDNPSAAQLLLRNRPGVTHTSIDGTTVIVAAPNVPARDLIQALVSAGVGLESVEQIGLSLEDAFLALTESPQP